MPQIQRPDLGEALRRKFDIVGPSSIDTISPELVGVVIVDEILPRLDRAEGIGSNSITGDANDIAESGLQNLDPARLLILDKVVISGSSTTRYRLRAGPPGGTVGAGGNIDASDLRGALLVPALTLSATDLNSVAGSANIYAEVRLLANTAWEWKPNLVLDVAGTVRGGTETDRIHVDHAQVASTLTASYFFHFESRGIRVL